MPLTSLVIWLENAESFMRVIIRVIYRITPSYSQLYKYLLCSARAGQVKREQFICNKNILLPIQVSLLIAMIFFVITTQKTADSMGSQTQFLSTAALRGSTSFVLKKAQHIILNRSWQSNPTTTFVYKNIQLLPQLLNPALWVQYLSTMFCNSI